MGGTGRGLGIALVWRVGQRELFSVVARLDSRASPASFRTSLCKYWETEWITQWFLRCRHGVPRVVWCLSFALLPSNWKLSQLSLHILHTPRHAVRPGPLQGCPHRPLWPPRGRCRRSPRRFPRDSPCRCLDSAQWALRFPPSPDRRQEV